MAEVATTKIFESESIIVWKMILEPGECTGVRTHHHNYMFYATQGSIIEVQDSEGNHLETITVNTGEVLEFRLDDDTLVSTKDPELIVPATHQACNRGDQTYTEVLVELIVERN
ncbi:MAG: hypothetical protein P1U34_12390 [Coxiellaceae bacterium]|nr:hypothetical protein [Coxiellaceae bacterium]